MMRPILIPWLIFIAYWTISARRARKNSRPSSAWWRWLGILAGVIFLLGSRSQYLPRPLIPQSGAVAMAAYILCASGIAFATWSRRHLGTNWSTAACVREGHELITSGPYNLVRHPIYAGVLLAVMGTALASGILWWGAFAVLLPIFIHRIHAEENLMRAQFPNEYGEYRKRTNALIPLVW